VGGACTLALTRFHGSTSVFKEAIRRNNAALIVSHNHPSSHPTPTPEDVLVTREIVAAGKLVDVDVLEQGNAGIALNLPQCSKNQTEGVLL
jgi:hypothetical protein